MKLKERVLAPTPKFFRKTRTIGLVLMAISGSVLATPVSLPAAVISLAGYAGLAGGIMSAVSQMTVESTAPPSVEEPVRRKAKKRKAVN